ncbi:hypothetical protein DBT_2081 [Dissulfuribacter thermophilus]|uniref:AsmA domain-containing protein n=1 Tax=Dissulfuribacter thermophilus TaxID=1156395 RepID=A0A1B9F3M5_9BACT|nr:AsmA-like C-terminal domain-containing protein [Dissulfuribacter thermophilus]OCC14539.1 hypothetical protein DBT_2081 [Dissulfuribacter thermophilus]
MKLKSFLRISLITLVFVIVLLVSALIALPYLLNNQSVKSKLEQILSNKANAEISFDNIELSYLPSLNFLIHDLKLQKGSFFAKANSVKVFPNLLGIIHKDDPNLIGAVTFKKLKIQHHYDIKEGKIKFVHEKILFSTTCTINGECNFFAQGILNPKTGDISGSLKARDSSIKSIVSIFLKGSSFEGKLQSFEAQFNTNFKTKDTLKIPSFSLALKAPVLHASGSMNLSRSDNQTRVDMNLDFKTPNLAKVRSYFLKHLGNKKVVKEICSIVRGGELERLNILYKGTTEGLKHVENYVITASAKDVPIYIPKLDLSIQKTTGSIAIKKGILTGKGLYATLKDTTCKDASIRLDLIGTDKRLSFLGNLSASSEDIVWAVKKIVKEKFVQNWAQKIQWTRGHMMGTLAVNGPLKKPIVEVNARPKDISIKFKGKFLPFFVKKGHFYLNTREKRVSLKEISGSYGDTHWASLSTQVVWERPVPFTLRMKDAQVDLKEGLTSIEHTSFNRKLKKIVNNVAGSLDIKDLMIKGDFLNPQKLHYTLVLDGADLELDSPLLPQKVKINSARGKIFNNNIRLKDLSLLFDDRTNLDLTLNLVHQKFSGFKGQITISGTVHNGVGTWIIGKNFIPEDFIPRLPIHLKDLKINFGKREPILISGEFSSVTKKGEAVHADLSFRKTQNILSLERLIINGPASNAVLRLEVNSKTKGGDPGKLAFLFKGVLSGKDLDALLKDNRLLIGKIKGRIGLCTGHCGPKLTVHKASYKQRAPKKSSGGVPQDFSHVVDINGDLYVKDLWWRWGVNRPILVQELALKGSNNHVKINKMLFTEGSISGSGNGVISSTKNGFSTTLTIFSKTMDVDEILSLFTKKKQKLMDIDNKPTLVKKKTKFLWPDVINDIKIDFETPELIYNDRILNDVHGNAILLKDGKINIDILSSLLCGVHAALGYEKSGEDYNIRLNVWTEEDEKRPDLKDTLECLGVPGEALSGPFQCSITLEGMTENWTKGSFMLKAGPGIIKHSSMFSKIFSILNVIDLFSKQGLDKLFSRELPYSYLEIEGPIENNNLVINRLVLKAEGLNFYGTGNVALNTWDIDLYILVSPFKAIDLLLSKIPIVGYVIGGKNRTLVTVPLKLSGSIKDPEVVPLDPKALSKGVLDIFKNVISIPIRVIVPEKTLK